MIKINCEIKDKKKQGTIKRMKKMDIMEMKKL